MSIYVNYMSIYAKNCLQVTISDEERCLFRKKQKFSYEIFCCFVWQNSLS